MAERFDQQQTHKSDFHSDFYSETSFPLVFNQVSSRFDSSKDAVSTGDDDLIATLQSRRENLRARQVFEWEMTRRGVGNSLPQNYYGAL